MTQSGYYRFPTIQANQIIFVCEDDLWRISLEEGDPARGLALRLTNSPGEITRPILSPRGDMVAFTGEEEGHSEVYCMDAKGGTPRRLTFLGAMSRVVGWTPDGKNIIFATNGNQPFMRTLHLFQISCKDGVPQPLPWGPGSAISYGPSKGVVLGRNTGDPARWKRYRGGTAGVLWVDSQGKGNFKKLLDLNGNLTSPMWVGRRIYFISDHEQVGALYSCTPTGKDIQRHSPKREFYLRHGSTDGKRIVYQAGGELYLFDPKTNRETHLSFQFHSPQVQRNRKFVPADSFLEDYSLHPEGHSLAITSRGKTFLMANWEEGVSQMGTPQGVRYRLTQWLAGGEKLVTLSDEGDGETLEIYHCEDNKRIQRLAGLDLGRPLAMKASPTQEKVALSNHRHELYVVDLKKKKAHRLDSSPYGRIEGFDWSPDGKWIAYSFAENQQTSSIKLCHIEKRKPVLLTPPRFRDYCPSFDPEGRFLYFLSYREFDPVYDGMYFDLNFPKGTRPFLIALQKDGKAPFLPTPKGLNGTDEEKPEKKKPSPKRLSIDLKGIQQRIAGFPLPEGKYLQIAGMQNKVVFTSAPVEGSMGNHWMDSAPPANATLETYSLETLQKEVVATEVSDFQRTGETIVYRSGNRIRVITPSSEAQKKQNEKAPNRETGWVDLHRIKVCVEPRLEWRQMYSEIWRLQRDHYWSADMCGINWKKIFRRYLPLLDKITTRSEFSDLIWEMQGELGTSHAYELGGDYRRPPGYYQGFLGADFKYSKKNKAYEITHIVQGDHWDAGASSPLAGLGAHLSKGDFLLAIDGQPLSATCSPQKLLVHKRGQMVNLLVRRKGEKKAEKISVKTLANETRARYRDWVEQNRRRVEKATRGQVGYLHIPDMGPRGYAEFHRYYLAEVEKKALIVDVRFNGGGHVSQLILEKLARKRIGYDISRWGKPEPYPSESILGPMVALTNEQAGSDGDIFSHCFKLMKLGTLIGKRTWGGVVGIWPRHTLVDGSITTQPEFSFWFEDVGWGVENYGTDPDIDVEITPSDWAKGKDPQLEKALEVISQELKKNPPHLPVFSRRPKLKIP